MFSYLVVFDDLLIVSRTRAREKTSWERQKPGMGVFPGLSKGANRAIGRLGYLTKVVGMYRRNNFVALVLSGLRMTLQRGFI